MAQGGGSGAARASNQIGIKKGATEAGPSEDMTSLAEVFHLLDHPADRMIGVGEAGGMPGMQVDPEPPLT